MAQRSGECPSAPGLYDFDQYIEDLSYKVPRNYATVNNEVDIEVSEDELEVLCRKNMARSASGPYLQQQCRIQACQG